MAIFFSTLKAILALAGPDTEKPRPIEPTRFFHFIDQDSAWFALADLNHDGRLSPDEWRQKTWDDLLQHHDLDGDGVIKRAEFVESVFRAMRLELSINPSERLERALTDPKFLRGIYSYFDVMDVNKNGILEREESDRFADYLFSLTDINKDGFVTEDEVLRRANKGW